MIKVLSAAHQRRFKLVVILCNAQNYKEISYLAKELNCNERTIKEDIKELSSSEVSKIFEIESRSKKYKLHMKNNMSLDAFAHYIMCDNDCFSLLEYVFFNNHLSADELAEKNHISLPTLYRMITRINNGLMSQYQLKFQTNPCRLEGDEVEIRSFYLQYFVEKYPVSEWPFDEIDEDKFVKIFHSFTKSIGFISQVSFLRTIKILLAVSTTRFNQGYRINASNPRLTLLKNKISKSSIIQEIFSDTFLNETKVDVFNDTLAYFVTDYFFFNYEELLKDASDNEYTARSFIHLSDIFNEVSKKYNVPLVNRDALIYNVHNSAEMGLKNINVRYILIDNKAVLLQQIKSLFPEFYNDMELRIKKYLEIMNLDYTDELFKHLIHNIMTRWENLLKHLYSRQRKIKVRVISSHDIYHARLMKTLLKHEFHDQIKVSILNTTNMGDLLEIKPEIDIFISNFTIPMNDERIVAINDIPTNEDFAVINEMIRKIRLNENSDLVTLKDRSV